MSEARVIAVGSPPTFRAQVARALEAAPEDVEWVPSVAAAEELLANDTGAHVVVLSPAVKEQDAFGVAEFLGRHAPATAVLLVRDRAPNGLLPMAMRAGIRDVVDLSRGGHELREALHRSLRWSLNLRSLGAERRPETTGLRGTVVSVFSSKGGTGKTFLTTNLGAALAVRSRKDTAILDGDFLMGDVMSYFGREATRSLQDLLAVGELTDPEAVRGAGTKLGDNLFGFAAPLDPAAEPVPGETMGKLVRSLRGAFSYVVVDASATYSDQALAAMDVSDQVLLITSLDLVAVRHLSSSLRTLLSLGLPRDRFRVVLNRADSKVGLDREEVERVLKVQVDVAIPSSRLVPLSLNRGRPVYLEDPKSPVSRAIEELADRVIALGQGQGREAGFGNGEAAEARRRGFFRRTTR
jgi:pilus assembly protein CpaE